MPPKSSAVIGLIESPWVACMELDTAQRTHLVTDLLNHLAAAISGSDAVLRGSLAEARADPYSDKGALLGNRDRRDDDVARRLRCRS